MKKLITISSINLYKKVWEIPMIKLAKEFEISDVGLRKACKGNEIPTPPVGYWRKLQTGKKVSKVLLPGSLKKDKEIIFGGYGKWTIKIPR